MTTYKINKRRIIHIAQLRKQRPNFKEGLQAIQKDFVNLLSQPELAKNLRYLRRISISIKQLQHDAQAAKAHPEMRQAAEQVHHFLCTPLGAPFVAKTTLARAAETVSEQEPHLSDLSEILQEMSKYGPKFSLQLLRIFSLFSPPA